MFYYKNASIRKPYKEYYKDKFIFDTYGYTF